MNLLDENIDDGARQLLLRWRVRVQKIGKGIGSKGMGDEEVIPLLHTLKSVTFFTYDVDYYRRPLCHLSYCLVYLDLDEEKTAVAIRRFLRHPAFRTWAQRKGKVIRISPKGMHVWQRHARALEEIPW